jgi:heme A synthase
MRGHDVFRVLAVLACLACYVTILLGGNVMASDSGLACPDWPTCHGTFLPPLSGPTGIEWAHRLSAATLALLTASLALAGLLFERGRATLARLGGAAFVLVLAQAALGGWVVVSGLTVAIVLLHLAAATVLFGLLLLLALLANLREMPRRWVAWIHRATEERPLPVADDGAGAPAPGAPAAVARPWRGEIP